MKRAYCRSLLVLSVGCLLGGAGNSAFSFTQTQREGVTWTLSIGVPSAEVQRYSPQRSAMALDGDEAGGGTSHEELFTWVNFIILLAALIYVLRKPISAFFTGRSRVIREGLEAGRRALAEAQERLREVEAKLSRMEEEIAAFRAAAAREMEAERARLRESTEREAARILDSARLQIEASARAAQLNLKTYTAGETVRLAEEMIRRRLDDATRARLVTRFVAGLKAGETSERKN